MLIVDEPVPDIALEPKLDLTKVLDKPKLLNIIPRENVVAGITVVGSEVFVVRTRHKWMCTTVRVSV